jgi:mono/diheme cytochrome c family protein
VPRRTLIILVLLAAAGLAVGIGLGLTRRAAGGSPATIASTWDPRDPDLGRKAYSMCLGCHGLDGRGVPGFAPPLVGARWLLGPDLPAILIVLHGYDATGEPGAAYTSARMAGHAHQLSDGEIAALLSWARSQWGNQGPGVSPEAVGAARRRFAARTAPWSPAELRRLAP